MPAHRTPTTAPPKALPRSGLNSSYHPVVDSVLKDLKQCTRRLQPALASQHVELQVLEKLYYKGNNQHRTALFWRRVCDIRRFGRRLEGVRLHALVDRVRLSFWGNDVQSNSKSLKGPWLYYPDGRTVEAALRRLVDCHILVKRMHEHVGKAHNHFNLQFQTGAFLQLILTLTAISARIAILLTEIQYSIEAGCHALHKLLLALHPTIEWRVPWWLKVSPIIPASVAEMPSARASQAIATHILATDIDEDIGISVTLGNIAATTAQNMSSPKSCREDNLPVPTVAVVHSSEPMSATSQVQLKANTALQPIAQKETDRVSAQISFVERRDAEHANQAPKAVKRKPKKKKKIDEIDEIFGF
ncbi:hypothetical protein BC835DRAFT_1344488 [Cytidiella melzeri]|nr:hypothetical protein BC835DRAFT_1344488 [Cytidiella melzeri]